MKCCGILFAKMTLKYIKKHYVCNVSLMYFRYVGKPSFPLGKQAFPDNAKCDGETLIKPVVYEVFWGTFCEKCLKTYPKSITFAMFS